MGYRDVAGCDVGNHLRNEEGIVFRSLLRSVHRIVACLLLECVETADTCGEYHAHAVLVNTFVLKTCVGDCLVGCSQGIHRIEVELTHLATVKMSRRIVTLHLTCELRLEFGGIEVCDRSRAALSLLGGLPCGGYVVTEGAEGTETRHYYSL